MASLGNCSVDLPGHRDSLTEGTVTGGLMTEGKPLVSSKQVFSPKVNTAWSQKKDSTAENRVAMGHGDWETRKPALFLHDGLTECIFLTISRCEPQRHMGDLFLLQQKSIGHDINVSFQEKSNSTKSRPSRKFKEKQFLLSVLMNTIK